MYIFLSFWGFVTSVLGQAFSCRPFLASQAEFAFLLMCTLLSAVFFFFSVMSRRSVVNVSSATGRQSVDIGFLFLSVHPIALIFFFGSTQIPFTPAASQPLSNSSLATRLTVPAAFVGSLMHEGFNLHVVSSYASSARRNNSGVASSAADAPQVWTVPRIYWFKPVSWRHLAASLVTCFFFLPPLDS